MRIFLTKHKVYFTPFQASYFCVFNLKTKEDRYGNRSKFFAGSNRPRFFYFTEKQYFTGEVFCFSDEEQRYKINL